MKNNKNKKWILVVVTVLLVAPILVSVSGQMKAWGVDACVTDECKEARAKANEAQEKANESNAAARAYETKVKELQTQVAAQEATIEMTKGKIDDLKLEIKKTEENLDKKQEALAKLLVNNHFESDREPIRILAGSNSISDLAEKASREQVARQQISTVAAEIRDTKEQLEENKAEVEDLLEEQKTARKELVAKKKEQQEFVDKYKNDAEAYAEVAKAERMKQIELEQQAMKDNPWLFGGGIAYASAEGDTYPWRDRCPQNPSNYQYVNPIGGGYLCECVSYAGWKVYERYGYELFWGNANEWYGAALASSDIVAAVDHNPTAGTVGQTGAGPYGHVFWVESVENGMVNITEYNNWYSTELVFGNGSGWMFGARTITMAEAQQYNYIHFK